MRIELPQTTWAQTHRAQDDAHTLTLPAERPVTLSEAWLAAADTVEGFRVAIPAGEPRAGLDPDGAARLRRARQRQ